MGVRFSCLLGFCLVAAGPGAMPLLADSRDSDKATDNTTFMRTDSDGVPTTMMPGQGQPLTQADIDMLQRERQDAAKDKDWLVRGYEQQLQSHSFGDASDNLYYELSSNKELAKLAGLPEMSDDNPSSSPRTQSSSSTSPAPTSASSPNHPAGFQPLITPLSDAAAIGSHSFYTPLPLAMPSPFAVGAPAPPPQTSRLSDQDSPDIDTPGMVAAQDNAMASTIETDPSLDLLPGETIEQAKERQDGNLRLQLSLPGSPNDLLKVPTTAADGTSTTTPPSPVVQATSSANPKAIPVNDADAPVPIDKMPVITPVHAPIASPYDVLNR